MSPDDRYDDFDELLRSALQDEADTVTPAGDGLARIQQRVQARDLRARWLRPALALGSAAVLAGVGVGAAVLVNSSGNDSVQVGDGNHNSSRPSASASNEPVVNLPPFPAQAIFPFTTISDEQGWQQDYNNGGTTWQADPTQVATRWVQDYLDEPSVDHVISVADDSGDKLVTLGRVLQGEGNNLFAVTAVHLTKYDAAWIVTGASDPNSYLTISAPTPGSTIKTPVTVTGPGFGSDEGIQLFVRDATSDTSYGTANLTVGNGIKEWSQGVNFNRPSSPIGALVAVDTSNADGGPARIVAEQVQFSPAEPNQPPPYFYAVKNNRIDAFASRTGTSIHYLTAAQPGGGLTDPQVYGTDVYYLQGAGTCANALMKVSLSADGSDAGESVASPDNGYAIASYAVGETSVSTFEQSCDQARSPQARLVTTPLSTGATAHTIDFPSLPPTLIGDPSFQMTGATQLMTAIVRGGTQNSLTNYDVYGDTDPQPNRPACAGLGPNDGQPNAIEIDSNGDLWVALQTGTSMDVVRCTRAGKVKLAFTIPGNDQPADIDVTGDGSAVLLTDTNGKVWRWDGGGNPTELPQVAMPLTQVTW
jgi:hypothetical protein